MAWAAGSWLYLGLACSLSALLMLLYFLYVPESPRWLLTKGRVGEAERILQRIAEKNGTAGSLRPGQLESYLKYLNEKHLSTRTEVPGILTLFKKLGLLTHIIMLSVSFSVTEMLDAGIAFDTTLSGNEFINSFLLAIIQLPAAWLGDVLAGRTGRRWTQVFFLCFSGIAFGLTVFATIQELPTLAILFLMTVR